MSELRELLERRSAAVARRDQLEGAQEDWQQRYWAANDFWERSKLQVEHANANWMQEMTAVDGELAHLKVLLDVHLFIEGLLPEPGPGCAPAFSMSCDEVIEYLCSWIETLVCTSVGAEYISNPQRLLLAWCAQILVSQAPHSATPVYPEDFLEAARSIIAYALDDATANNRRGVIGRDNPNSTLMLAFAAFPFLEGVSRRRLAEFMNERGTVLQEFVVDGRTYSPGQTVSSLAVALRLLEVQNRDASLGPRLEALRQAIVNRGVAAETSAVSSGATDLFSIVAIHRNSNLHGGWHVAHIGFASFLLAVVIGLDSIRHVYAELADIARMVIRLQAPGNPRERWPHWVFYPPTLNSASRPDDSHCLHGGTPQIIVVSE